MFGQHFPGMVELHHKTSQHKNKDKDKGKDNGKEKRIEDKVKDNHGPYIDQFCD